MLFAIVNDEANCTIYVLRIVVCLRHQKKRVKHNLNTLTKYQEALGVSLKTHKPRGPSQNHYTQSKRGFLEIIKQIELVIFETWMKKLQQPIRVRHLSSEPYFNQSQVATSDRNVLFIMTTPTKPKPLPQTIIIMYSILNDH